MTDGDNGHVDGHAERQRTPNAYAPPPVTATVLEGTDLYNQQYRQEYK